jgi:hypothetical protein
MVGTLIRTDSCEKLSAQACDLCLSWVISIGIKHFDIFKLSIHIPLNSTVFPILKFKIENGVYQRLSSKMASFHTNISFH